MVERSKGLVFLTEIYWVHRVERIDDVSSEVELRAKTRAPMVFACHNDKVNEMRVGDKWVGEFHRVLYP